MTMKATPNMDEVSSRWWKLFRPNNKEHFRETSQPECLDTICRGPSILLCSVGQRKSAQVWRIRINTTSSYSVSHGIYDPSSNQLTVCILSVRWRWKSLGVNGKNLGVNIIRKIESLPFREWLSLYYYEHFWCVLKSWYAMVTQQQDNLATVLGHRPFGRLLCWTVLSKFTNSIMGRGHSAQRSMDSLDITDWRERNTAQLYKEWSTGAWFRHTTNFHV